MGKTNLGFFGMCYSGPNWGACTGRSRAPIPGQGEHPFRSKVSTDSGDAERAFRAR